jgi:glycosyltransferase involved in cell wall biosynthesis
LEIHQITPALLPGDARGNCVVEIWKQLQRWGYHTSILAQHCHPTRRSICEDYRRYSGSSDNLLIYHYGEGSDLTEFVLQLPDRVVLYYHNITPARFYHSVNSRIESYLARGREDLALFTDSPFAMASSEYNRQDLLASGFRDVAVVPYIMGFDDLDASARSGAGLAIRERFGDGAANILFVGRIAPNKCQGDLIKVFAYYHTLLNPHSRLLLVGSSLGTEAYRFRLEFLAQALGLADSVLFCGQAGLEEGLGAYYQVASAFVCMSEHEGFCIPLLEAAHFGVPVIAYSAAGVPYTLGDSGILVKEKKHGIIAELVDLVIQDPELRRNVIQGQSRLLERFSREKCIALLREAIDTALSVPSRLGLARQQNGQSL